MLDNEAGEPVNRREMFNTYLVLPDGRSRVWARH